MIDENKDLFNKVSRQNLKRAEQVRHQFSDKRNLLYDKLNSRHQENRVKLS